MLVPSILQVRELSATAKSSVSYIANAAREGQPRQGFATCKNFCSDFSQADWQHDCFQTVTLRKSVHVQNVNPGVGNIYLGERFAAFESPVAYMVCILTELNLLDAALRKSTPAELRPAGRLACCCLPRLVWHTLQRHIGR